MIARIETQQNLNISTLTAWRFICDHKARTGRLPKYAEFNRSLCIRRVSQVDDVLERLVEEKKIIRARDDIYCLVDETQAKITEWRPAIISIGTGEFLSFIRVHVATFGKLPAVVAFQKQLGLSATQVHFKLNDLVDSGHVQRDQSGAYRLTEQEFDAIPVPERLSAIVDSTRYQQIDAGRENLDDDLAATLGELDDHLTAFVDAIASKLVRSHRELGEDRTRARVRIRGVVAGELAKRYAEMAKGVGR